LPSVRQFGVRWHWQAHFDSTQIIGICKVNLAARISELAVLVVSELFVSARRGVVSARRSGRSR